METPKTKPQVPAKGGSYMRDANGNLTQKKSDTVQQNKPEQTNAKK